MTAREEEGLWAAGAGEDFGRNGVARHPLLGRGGGKALFGTAAGDNDDNAEGTSGGDGMDTEEKKENQSDQDMAMNKAKGAWRAARGMMSKSLGSGHVGFVDRLFYGDSNDDGNMNGNSD